MLPFILEVLVFRSIGRGRPGKPRYRKRMTGHLPQ